MKIEIYCGNCGGELEGETTPRGTILIPPCTAREEFINDKKRHFSNDQNDNLR